MKTKGKDGEEDEVEEIEVFGDRYLQRVVLEAYLIRGGHVHFTIQDWHRLPASYAGRLYLTLVELDKLEKEEIARQRKGAG